MRRPRVIYNTPRVGGTWWCYGLVPLLPASLCKPDTKIRIALGERHAEKCAMRKTLSGGFWTVSRMALEDEVRRGVEPRLLVLMVRLLVLWNFGSLARWVRGSIPPLTPRCTVLVTRSSPNLSMAFLACGPKNLWNKVYSSIVNFLNHLTTGTCRVLEALV